LVPPTIEPRPLLTPGFRPRPLVPVAVPIFTSVEQRIRVCRVKVR
jgi:hypothetical protein